MSYLNLPNADNQSRIADAVERLAEGKAKVTDATNAPGPKVLVAGTRENGFYGFVSAQEMGELFDNPVGKRNFDGANLALAIGLASGTAFNIDTPWMKFSRRGEIYFVPVKPIRYSAPWDAIYRQGAVYGDETVGVVPPNGRAGKRLSVSAASKAFLIEKDGEGHGFLRPETPTAKVGDTIVTKGFVNAENNGEFVVQSISDTAIVVDKALKEEGSAPKGVIYEKTKAVKQDRVVKVGSNRFRVQLLKGAAQDPLNSYLDADRDMVGPESEWSALILPMHENAKLQNWAYKAYAGTTEDWGIGLTDADLLTHHRYGYGSYTWCQETSDDASYRRVLRGYNGASFGYSYGSWGAWYAIGFRPVLRLI